MSRIQSLGHSYTPNNIKNQNERKNTAFNSYMSQSVKQDTFNKSNVSFGGPAKFLGNVLTKMGNALEKSNEIGRLFDEARKNIKALNKWAIDLPANTDLNIKIGDKVYPARINSAIKSKFDLSIDLLATTNNFSSVDDGVVWMDRLLKTNPELKPIYRKFFTDILKQDNDGKYEILSHIQNTESLIKLYNKALKKVS